MKKSNQSPYSRKTDDSALSRRKFLKNSAIGMAGLLAGCAFAKKGKKNIPLTPPAYAGSETFKGGTSPTSASAGRLHKSKESPLTHLKKGGMPNILLVLADDQGMHMSCLDTPGISTPNMDALAKNGVMFLNAHSTCASCSPSRSSILTGMYPHSNGHWRNTVTPVINAPAKEFGHESSILDKVGVHEDIPTLVEILNKHDYLTGITRKWHLSPHWKFPFDKRIHCGHTSEQTHDKCAQFFKKANNNPFFLMLNLTNTHRPFKPAVLKGARVPPEDVYVPPQLADTKLMREDLSDYYSDVQSLDLCLGGAMNALKESGKLDNTLVIYTSDHGWAYHRAKATIYDAGTHVPLIISGPKIAKGKVVKDGVSLIDLMPTILDYTKIKIPKTVQGISLLPVLENKKGAKGRKLVFTEHHAHGPGQIYPSRSVNDGRFHYIVNLMPNIRYHLPADLTNKNKVWGNTAYDATVNAKDTFPVQYKLLQRTFKRPAEELYDLHTDPGEINNLVNDPRYAEFLKKMRNAMKKWRKDTNDTIDDPRKIIRRTE